ALVAELLGELGHHFVAVVHREPRRRRRHLRRFCLGRRRGLGRVLLRLRLRLLLLLRSLLRGPVAARLLGLRALLLFLVLVLVLGHAYASTCSPFALKMRTLRPSSSCFTPLRSAFLVAGLKSAMFETWIGRSLSTMPPV